MERFDEQLRERAQREPFPIPEDYAGRVFQTCAGLEDRAQARTQTRRSRYWGRWVAAALALFLLTPNVSPTAAAAMTELPVLGAVVKLITFRNYAWDDGVQSAEASVPELSDGAAAQTVDAQVQEYTERLLAAFQEKCETELGPEGYAGLDVTSRVVTDTEDWFTLRIDATETMASGYEFSRFFHIDKTADAVVTLADLFRPGADYSTALTAEVLRQMEEQMARSEEVVYFPEELTAIGPDQNFYLNEDGNIVLVFDEYAVAPGSMGMPEFTIPTPVVQDLLR